VTTPADLKRFEKLLDAAVLDPALWREVCDRLAF
jgi:hypothetical protein